MHKSLIILASLIMLLFSGCRTAEKVVINLNIEEEKKIREWEEYMNFTGEQDLSIGTALRLTEEYLQARDIIHKRAMDEYENNLALYQKGQLKVAPTEPVQEYSKLTSRFKSLAKHYRYGRGADTVQYILGFALYEDGKRDEAARVFEELIKTYPKTEYALEVNFRLGEFYYDTGQFGEAMEAFRRVLARRDSLFYEKAVYKTGWVHYKLDDFTKAAGSFTDLAEMKWISSGKQDGLTSEALTCAVMSLAHFKDVAQSIKFLDARKEKAYIPSIMTEFGEKLQEETRFEAAIAVYKTFEEWFPEDPELPFIYDRIAYIYDRMADEEKTLAADRELIHKFNPSTPWYKKTYPDRSARTDALLSKKILDVSRKYHVRGKKESRIEDLEKAIDGYRIFISSFPESPEAKKISLMMGEAMFDSKKYAEAVEAYKKTAALYPAGAERGDVAYSAFLACEVIFYQAEKGDEQAIEAAASVMKEYEQDLEKNGKMEKARHKLADMYAQIGAYGKAREAIAPLAGMKDSAPVMQMTAELYLKEGNLAAAEEIYAKLVEKSGPQAFKEALASIRYRMAQESVKNQRSNEAAVKFNQVFSMLPGSPVGEAALASLGSLYLDKKEIEALEEVTGRLMKAYPNSKETLPLMVDAGRVIEREEPQRAARIYEGASGISGSKEASLKLVLAAAILYEKGKEDQKAEPLFRRYLDEGKPAAASEAAIRISLGKAQLRLGKKKEGMDNFGRVAAMEGKVEDALVGSARLLLLEGREKAYLDLKLTQPFEETLQNKTDLLNGLLKEYSQVAKYKVPDLLPEVYFRMGTALENFRDAMIHSERPAGLNKQELEEYSFLLEERAYPYEEQSVKAYERGLTAGGKNNINNEWVERSLARLAALRPALYKRETGEKGLELLSPALEPVKLEKEL